MIEGLFDTVPTLEGFAVIDTNTGHPIKECFTPQEAKHFIAELNQAASEGPKALISVLNAK